MPALIEKLSKAKPEPLIRAWAFLVTVSPTPFAHPRGKGLSSPTVNVVWALFNPVIGYILFRVGKVWEWKQLSTRCFLRTHRRNKLDVECAICKEAGEMKSGANHLHSRNIT
jgi:hypothetical protein